MFHASTTSVLCKNDFCYTESNGIRIERPRMCYEPEEREEGRKAGRLGERERENERAKESRREEINTDSE